MRYFIELRYDGAEYCGWQRQPIHPTVQEAVEKALTILLREPIAIMGAGRTDSGVNASYYVAHFDCQNPIEDTEWALFKINYILPKDISAFKITPVPEKSHARFHALEREYIYFISPFKNPFLRASAWQYFFPLDVEKMNQAASMLLLHSDFTSFAKLNADNKTNICHIMQAQWDVREDGVLCFTIRANRFLRNMVRSLVGTLVDVGRGRYTIEQFVEIIEARDLARSSAGAPAQGLFLNDVVYPPEIFSRSVKQLKYK